MKTSIIICTATLNVAVYLFSCGDMNFRYIVYWSKKFNNVELSAICLKETVDVSLNGRSLGWQTCFMLGKNSTEDTLLRKKLHNERLVNIFILKYYASRDFYVVTPL